ncbi:MAG TPA: hypothetical protein VFY21_13830 [Xanthobacteraceae bacterium]|nr:hypothetical protein [Xanthobacteraceae bacterium]
MFRIWKKRRKFPPARPRRVRGEPDYFASLPFIDNETLDQFLADPGNLERLPVDPTEYRPEFQRLIVSAFFHEASTRAKHVEHA